MLKGSLGILILFDNFRPDDIPAPAQVQFYNFYIPKEIP